MFNGITQTLKKKAFALGATAILATAASAYAGETQVRWSEGKEQPAVNVQGMIEAGKAIADLVNRLRSHHPVVRFSNGGVGGTAIVPLWPYDPGSRCSPNFDLAPFDVAKGKEVLVKFEFVNIEPGDQARIAFAIKADKPGREDRYRADHDIGNGTVGNKPSMTTRLATPTSGDYAFYFLDRGQIKTDEIVRRNPGAAIRITILEKP